jgi:predicted nucleic acid-binding protein
VKIILDANVLFAALLSDGLTRKLILSLDGLIAPEFLLEEFEKHRDYLKEKSGNPRFDVSERELLRRISFIPTEDLKPYKKEAIAIIGHIDIDDVAYIACALAHSCAIWSDDAHFRKQDIIPVFTTAQMRRNHSF